MRIRPIRTPINSAAAGFKPIARTVAPKRVRAKTKYRTMAQTSAVQTDAGSYKKIAAKDWGKKG